MAKGPCEELPAHAQKWPRIIAGKPCPFLNPTVAAEPVADGQPSIPPALPAGSEVGHFDHPLAAFADPARGNGLTCEVEVCGSHHVQLAGALKQSERCAEARIDVEQLVGVIPSIVPIADVKNPCISAGLHELEGESLHGGIVQTDSQCGHAHVRRPLPDLSA